MSHHNLFIEPEAGKQYTPIIKKKNEPSNPKLMIHHTSLGVDPSEHLSLASE